MKEQSPSVFGAFKTLILCCVVFYIGSWLSESEDKGFRWIGIAFSSFAALLSIPAFFKMAGASIKQSRQMRFALHAHTPSGNFGNAKLADINSSVINRLSKNKNGIFLGAYFNRLLFFNPFDKGNAHWIIYAPARTGKTSSVLTPIAMHWFDGSLIMPSIKRDTVAIALKHRKKNGHRVIEWNPFGVHGVKGFKFNILKILAHDVRNNRGINLQGFALLIANAMIPKTKSDENPFFRNGSVRLLAGYMIFLAVIRPWQCHLPGLNTLVWSSQTERVEVASLMKLNIGIGGLVKKYGNHLGDLFKPEYAKTFGSMLDYAIDATMIYDSNTDFGKSLMGDDFDLKDILDGKTTFFPVIPEDKLVPYGQSIGLTMAIIFELIAALKSPMNILMVLDEAGNFGSIPNMSKAMTLLPEKGLRIVKAYQSQNQHVELYGENDAANHQKQCTGKQEWAINDLNAAKTWGEYCGKQTVKDYSLQYDPNDPQTPWKPNVSEKERPVRSADQILAMPAYKQFIKINAEPVIEADLVAYYEIKEWREKAALNPYHPNGYPIDKPVKYRLSDVPK